MSEKITAEQNFIENFSKLIHELKAPKGQKNTFGKYNYRSAEDILEAVKPIAFKYGLIINLTDTIKLIGDRYYVEAVASVTDGINRFSSTGLARESEVKKGMDDSQITGTASSYARKYALNGLLLIDDTKDADTDEYKQENNSKAPKKITKLQAQAMLKKIDALAELVSIKTNKKVTGIDMWQKISDTKFLSVLDINALDTEQYMTVKRYTEELEKAYAKK